MAHGKIDAAPAELEAKRIKYLGWADDMTPARLARTAATLETIVDHEGQRITKRQFIIQMVRAGWAPRKEEGIPSWAKRNGQYQEGRSRTEYQIHKDGKYYKITRTEYEFASYLAEQESQP